MDQIFLKSRVGEVSVAVYRIDLINTDIDIAGRHPTKLLSSTHLSNNIIGQFPVA